jgi:serine protease inhibitor
MNRLACLLYAPLAAEHENLFFSPFSVASALAMAAEGARGETAREMGEVLGLGDDAKRNDPQRPYDWSALHASLGQLAARLAPRPPPAAWLAQLGALRTQLDHANAQVEQSDDFTWFGKARQLATEINQLQAQIDPTDFRSANALWVERTFALEAPYLDVIARHYAGGGAIPADFQRDPEGSRAAINDWVAAHTNQRIRNLLGPGTVDAMTRLVLANAVYFLGEWREPFDPDCTQREPFFLRDGGRVEVALMRARYCKAARYAAFHADGSLFPTPAQVRLDRADTKGRYPEDGFQMLELPYRGDQLVMQLILPLRADGLAAVEGLLEPDRLDRWAAALAAREVDVALPKFKLETGFGLASALAQLGMARAFVNPVGNADGAQFEGISAGEDPDRRLYIGAVVHKAFVQVDEKGTEAAAATGIAVAAGAAMPALVPFTPMFRADRAFVFLIRDRATGAVLFLGRLVRPQGD